MLRELFNRTSSLRSQKSPARAQTRPARPVIERLEDRQLMCGTICGDYVAGFNGGDFLCGVKVNNGNHFGQQNKLTGAV